MSSVNQECMLIFITADERPEKGKKRGAKEEVGSSKKVDMIPS